MEDESKRQSDAGLQKKILDAILAANEFEVPDALLERQIFYMMFDTQKRMRAAGMDETSAMDFSFKLHDQFKPEALKTVKAFLLVKKIAEKEGITVTDEDIDNQITKIAKDYHTEYEVVKQAYNDEERLDALKAELIRKRCLTLSRVGPILTLLSKKALFRRGISEFDSNGGRAGRKGRKGV